MKLSEAMMLGSTTCKMVRTDWNSCGLGCAGNAIGIGQAFITSTEDYIMPDGRARYEHLYDAWPWIADNGFANAIWGMFDDSVCAGNITFEELVDWVAEREPSCGDCNSFDCTCQTPAVSEAIEVPACIQS